MTADKLASGVVGGIAASKITVVNSPAASVPANNDGTVVTATCASGQKAIAGGWFTLCFGLSIFAARYALGVLFGVMPHLRAEPLWIAAAGGVGGLVTGIGVGWLGNLLWRAYRPSGVARG